MKENIFKKREEETAKTEWNNIKVDRRDKDNWLLQCVLLYFSRKEGQFLGKKSTFYLVTIQFSKVGMVSSNTQVSLSHLSWIVCPRLTI